METTPKSYVCECGEEHQFPSYVFAHWGDEIVHTCNKCGQKWEIYEGLVNKVEK
jgi:hypothetical protein